jgi:hypothetical protein
VNRYSDWEPEGGYPIEARDRVEEEGLTEDGRPVVSDEAALEAAEEAARHADDSDPMRRVAAPAEPVLSGQEADEPWVPVASAAESDPSLALQVAHNILTTARIPAAFDPYRPGEVRSPYATPSRLFRLLVPASRLAEARRVLMDAEIELDVIESAASDESAETLPIASGGDSVPSGTISAWGPPRDRSRSRGAGAAAESEARHAPPRMTDVPPAPTYTGGNSDEQGRRLRLFVGALLVLLGVIAAYVLATAGVFGR